MSRRCRGGREEEEEKTGYVWSGQRGGKSDKEGKVVRRGERATVGVTRVAVT